jgi:hypothetical protein
LISFFLFIAFKLVALDDEIECWMDEGEMEKDDFVESFQNVSFHEVFVEWLAQCSGAKRFITSHRSMGNIRSADIGSPISGCVNCLKVLIQSIEDFQDGLDAVAARFEVIEEELTQDLDAEEADEARMKDELELLEGDENDKGFNKEPEADSFSGIDSKSNNQIDGVPVKRVVCRDEESEKEITPSKVKFVVPAADVACPNGHKLRPYTSPVSVA